MASITLFYDTNFNNLSNELILLMAYFLDPISLYNFMFISKKHYNLIMRYLNKFINGFKVSSPLDVEKFLWRQFDNPYLLYNRNQVKLFFRMIKIYKLANTTQLEELWEQNGMDEWEPCGPLPIEPIELYEVKLWSSIFYFLDNFMFINIDVYKQNKRSYAWDISSNTMNDDELKMLFLFLTKYTEFYIDVCESLDGNIIFFVDEKGLTFDILDNYIQEGIKKGGELYHIYRVLSYDRYDAFIQLLTNGMSSADAFKLFP